MPHLRWNRRKTLIAFGTVSPWALAFAFAKVFANSIADANYAEADRLDNKLHDLAARVEVLQYAGHYHPSTVKHTPVLTTDDDDLQPSSTDLD